MSCAHDQGLGIPFFRWDGGWELWVSLALGWDEIANKQKIEKDECFFFVVSPSTCVRACVHIKLST